METMSRLEDVLARLPKSTDPEEVRIVDRIREELLATSWSKVFFNSARQLQIDFFKFALSNLQNPELIHSKNQELLAQLAELGKSKIISGGENLEEVVRMPFFIVSNHLGDYKLTTIRPEELGLKLPIDQIHPFPIYYASYQPIAQKFSAQLYDAHVELTEPLVDIEKACGLITIVINQGGGLARLESDTQELFEKHSNSILVVFPEGGTSGKRNGEGPYDLEEFHTGAFVIAGHLGVPVLPVAKFFDPEEGYKLGIFPPLRIKNNKDRGYYHEIASKTQRNLQKWLNGRLRK